MGLDTPTPAPPRWGLLRRILFRITCAYFVLYILPFPVNMLSAFVPIEAVGKFVSEWLTTPYQNAWNATVVWVGKRLFDIDIVFRVTGSGDTTWAYVHVLCIAVLAAAIALAWSLVDRRRPNYTRLLHWLRVYVRFYVAMFMISYGAVKVIKSQFPTPETERLLVSFGESSPMRLLWTFMGASEGYNWFTGGGEMLGGLLLCTRRTTLLGALVTAAVMLHVTVLNFCYDVPVKLFSGHLFLMAVFLTLPDWPWMFRVFVLGRRVEPRGVTPLTRWRWVNWTLAVIRTVAVVAWVWACLNRAQTGRETRGDLAPRLPLTGLWEVEEFESDGTVRPPLLTDAGRWRYATVSRQTSFGTMFSFQTMTGARNGYVVTIDPESQTLRLTSRSFPSPLGGVPVTPSQTPPATWTLTYRQPEPNRLELEGTIDKQRLKVRLRHVDESEFLLRSRGFHWINETPYNVTVPRGASKGLVGAGR